MSLRWDDDPPYFMQQGARVIGIDADLAREAMRRMACDLSLVKLPWGRALLELKAGRIDMISSAYRTPEREQYALYSEVAGLVSPNLLFTRTSDASRFRNTGLQALLASDFRLGAQIDVSYSDEYKKLLKTPQLVRNVYFSARRESLWRMLALNRVDGVIASKLTGLYELQQLGLSRKITPSSVVVSSKPAYFAFSSNSISADFVARFDRVLQRMIQDGTFEAIVNSHVCSTTRAALPEFETAVGACPITILKSDSSINKKSP